MDKIVLEGTDIVPDISFNPESGIMEIRGKSIPENVYEKMIKAFYPPMFDEFNDIKWRGL